MATGAALVLVAGALAPPLVEGAARVVVRQAFAPVCHQLPARSFAVGGVPLAVGHRCFGIYAGLLVGTLAWPLLAVRAKEWAGRHAGPLVLAAAAPAALDWLVGAMDVWGNTAASRTATGVLLGVALGLLLARAMSQAVASYSASGAPVREEGGFTAL